MPSRQCELMIRASSRRIWSPALWEWVSLMALKLSTSMRSRLVGLAELGQGQRQRTGEDPDVGGTAHGSESGQPGVGDRGHPAPPVASLIAPAEVVQPETPRHQQGGVHERDVAVPVRAVAGVVLVVERRGDLMQ